MSPASSTGNVIPVVMPQPGQSMEEGAIVRWLAREGEMVRQGDILFEVETDKAVLEVEAADSGRLARILVGEGVVVPVKTPVALLADNDAAADAFIERMGLGGASTPPAPGPASSAPPAPEPAASATAAPGTPCVGRVAASPLARKAARARGVALEGIAAGSGPRGRIMLADVERAATSTTSSAGAARRPLSRMRRAIARNLAGSKQTVPHFYMKTVVDADAMWEFRRVEKVRYPCSVNDVITLAVSRAMMEHPAFRTRWDSDATVERDEANIGIAVGVEDGLVVPVLRRAERLSLQGIAEAARRLISSARDGRVEGSGEATLTISNLGMFGVEEFSAIINPPEAAILAVGAVREEIVVRHGAFRAGRRLTITLSADHRVIDGITAARFMSRLKELLEDPAAIRP